MTDEEWEQNKDFFKVTKTEFETKVEFCYVRGIVQSADVRKSRHVDAYLAEDASKIVAEYVKDGILRALRDADQ